METQGIWGVTNAELEQAVAAVDRSAILAPARIVRRVLRRDRGLTESGLKVPHRKTYFVRREALAAIVDPAEIGYASFEKLPDVVVLLARPEPEQLAAMTRPSVLLKYWRLLFHARVHVELERGIAEGRLTADDVARRIAKIGALEFEEVRSVLRQENLLLPPVDDVSTYVEFLAVYCELKCFAPRLLDDYFPSLNADRVAETIAADFDAPRWFAATRLPGSPEPHEKSVEDEETLIGRRADPAATNPRKQSDRLYCRLMLLAERANGRGNDVGTAVMRWWAALRIGPKLAKAARDAGREDIRRLSFRLARALHADDDERRGWTELLEELLPQATRGLWPHERRFLYDLQKSCFDHEQGVFQLDLKAWLAARGKVPLRRELPNQREVMIAKHLRGALKRLSLLRVATPSRDRLSALLRAAAKRIEGQLRERLRPQILGALDDVGLQPTNRPETIARKKLAEELLDRTVERGFLNMGDLRDAVSRNNLKLRDVASPGELLSGDEVLRADKVLTRRLEGVYRKGEIYRRVPQWLSSAAFGTSWGRMLTKYVAVPFGGAYMILAFLHELTGLIPKRTGIHIEPINRWSVMVLGCFILSLYSPAFRRGCLEVLRAGRRLGYDLFVAWPKRLAEHPAVQRLMESRAFALFQQFFLKPLLTTVLLAILVSVLLMKPIRLPGVFGLFLFANLLVNSRVGRKVDEVVTDLAVRSWHHFRMRIVKTIVQATMEFFHEALEAMERVLYAVDEWLRFRSGESKFATAGKAAVGFVWHFVNYVIRFCVTLLVEPQVNPIKHFPVVTVSHKLILPLAVPPPTGGPSILGAQLMWLFGLSVESANWLAGSIVWGIPGIFGYAAWELRNNWSLYEANRPTNLQPVPVGGHGETIVRLLRPAFHSGTVPKTFARLRRSDRKAQATGSWQGPRKFHDRLHEVKEAATRFVDREFVELLNSCPRMRPVGLRLTDVGMGTGHLRFTLAGDGEFAEPLVLTLQEKAGWLTARAAMPAWFDRLEPEQARAITNAVLGLYKMSGVELVHEQIEACFAPDVPPYDVRDEGIVVRPDPNSDLEVLYELRQPAEESSLISPATPSTLPTLDRRRLVFAAAPIHWKQWVALWEREDRPAGETDAHDGMEPSWKRALRTPA